MGHIGGPNRSFHFLVDMNSSRRQVGGDDDRGVRSRTIAGSETEVADFRPPARVGNSLTVRLGNSLTGRVGNYLTELRPDWGIP
jgi:hypothetical protein